jgi:hypothetical protein
VLLATPHASTLQAVPLPAPVADAVDALTQISRHPAITRVACRLACSHVPGVVSAAAPPASDADHGWVAIESNLSIGSRNDTADTGGRPCRCRDRTVSPPFITAVDNAVTSLPPTQLVLPTPAAQLAAKPARVNGLLEAETATLPAGGFRWIPHDQRRCKAAPVSAVRAVAAVCQHAAPGPDPPVLARLACGACRRPSVPRRRCSTAGVGVGFGRRGWARLARSGDPIYRVRGFGFPDSPRHAPLQVPLRGTCVSGRRPRRRRPISTAGPQPPIEVARRRARIRPVRVAPSRPDCSATSSSSCRGAGRSVAYRSMSGPSC